MGLYGKMPGVAYQDYAHARLIVLWGVNPSASGIHLVPYIREAQRRGAKLVVIDPRRTPLAEQADLHLALRPGTDLPVALSVIRWLFAEGRADRVSCPSTRTARTSCARAPSRGRFARAAAESGVAAADLEAFARLYADSSPAALRCGWGLERNRNGGSAVAAILALPAVAGKFGVRGGGYTMRNSGAWKEIDGLAAARAPEPPTRAVNMNQLGAALAERGAAPRRPALRLQRQPARDAARPGARSRGSRARGPLHGRLRPGDDRHRPLRGRRPARDDVPRADGALARLRRLRAAAGGGRGAGARRGAAEPRGLRGALPPHRAWRCPAIPKPRKRSNGRFSRRARAASGSPPTSAATASPTSPRARRRSSSSTPSRAPPTGASTSPPRPSIARRRTVSTVTSRSPPGRRFRSR